MLTVKVLRNFRSGEFRGLKGEEIQIPAELAAELAKGERPAVQILETD